METPVNELSRSEFMKLSKEKAQLNQEHSKEFVIIVGPYKEEPATALPAPEAIEAIYEPESCPGGYFQVREYNEDKKWLPTPRYLTLEELITGYGELPSHRLNRLRSMKEGEQQNLAVKGLVTHLEVVKISEGDYVQAATHEKGTFGFPKPGTKPKIISAQQVSQIMEDAGKVLPVEVRGEIVSHFQQAAERIADIINSPDPEPRHTFYETGDANCPPSILDSNGEVCLAYCKVCGQAEATLEDTCPGAEHILDSMDSLPLGENTEETLQPNPCCEWVLRSNRSPKHYLQAEPTNNPLSPQTPRLWGPINSARLFLAHLGSKPYQSDKGHWTEEGTFINLNDLSKEGRDSLIGYYRGKDLEAFLKTPEQVRGENQLDNLGQPKQQFSTGAVRGTDANATRFDLLSPIVEYALAATYGEGASKYGDDNWLKGIPSKDCINHARRHIILWMIGDDSEDHLAHAIWNLATIIHNRYHKPEMIVRQYSVQDPLALLKELEKLHYKPK